MTDMNTDPVGTENGRPGPLTVDPRINTNIDWYLSRDPTAAAPQIVEFIRSRARGRRLLDVGGGTGAYAYTLQKLGYEVVVLEPNERYVEIARAHGVDARHYTPGRFPFPDAEFDTVFAVEVFEHIPDAGLLATLAEARRVARQNLLVTVPSNDQYEELVGAQFLYAHYRVTDHVQHFTTASLEALLRRAFPLVTVAPGDPMFPHRLLPRPARRCLSLLYRLGVLRPTIFERLYAEAAVHG